MLVLAHHAWLRDEDVQLVVIHMGMRMPRDGARGLRMFYLWLRDEDSWLTAQMGKLLLPCMGVSAVDVSHQPSIPKDGCRGRGVVGLWQLLLQMCPASGRCWQQGPALHTWAFARCFCPSWTCPSRVSFGGGPPRCWHHLCSVPPHPGLPHPHGRSQDQSLLHLLRPPDGSPHCVAAFNPISCWRSWI